MTALVVSFAALTGCLDASRGGGADPDGGDAPTSDGASPGPDAASLDDWTRSATVTVAGLGQTLDDVPVLVYLTSARMADLGLASDLRDLRFADGGEILPHDAAPPTGDGTVAVYVHLDVLPLDGTTFEVYGGNPDATAPAAEGVWQGFSGVWHLDAIDGLFYPDATGKHPAELHGDHVEAEDGWVGRAARFDITQYLQVAHDPDFNPLTSLTVEIAIRPTQVDNTQRFGVYNGGFQLNLTEDSTETSFVLWDADSPNGTSIPGSVATQNQWIYLVGTYDGDTQRIYTHGALDFSVNQDLTIDDNGADLIIGQVVIGDIDEVRVSTVARSDRWIEAQQRMRDADAIVSVGPAQDR